MTEQYIRMVFDCMLQHLLLNWGLALDLEVRIDTLGDYPKPRDFAKTDGRVIYLSPKILSSDIERVEGLLYHELGHAILMDMGDYTHSERSADLVAEECFDVEIYYDEIGVQTTLGGRRPRPSHLPK